MQRLAPQSIYSAHPQWVHGLPQPHPQMVRSGLPSMPFTPPAFYRMRGPAPQFCQPAVTLESRIYDMNKRLQHRSEDPDNTSLWWDAFGHEFFDDDATLTLEFQLEDGPKRYTIGRTLIPRYFRSIFEGGVKDLYYLLRYPTRECLVPGGAVHECDNAVMVTRHDKPMAAEVFTEGRLICEFSLDNPTDFPRIRRWIMTIRSHQEFIPRGALTCPPAADGAQYQEQLTKNITRQGMTSFTLNYLRLCVILEPMQQLMSQHKTFKVPPRECLRTTLFQRFQASQIPQPRGPPAPIPQPIMPVEEPPARPAGKRKRNRKGSQSGGATPTGGGGKKSKSTVSPAPAPASFPLASHVDVMVVGEPSLMGGEYGEEDERMISRMENTQFDPVELGVRGPPGVAPGAPSGVLGGPGGPTPGMEGGPIAPPQLPPGLPFDPAQSWPPVAPQPHLSTGAGGAPGGVRTPQTPQSRTATPSAPTPGGTAPPAGGSPAGTGNGGRRSVKAEVVEGGSNGSGGPAVSTA